MTTDTAKPDSTELVTIPADTALDVFTDPAKLDGVLQQIRAKVDAFVPDLSTAAGRDRVKSFAFKISQSKTYLDGLAQKEYQAASEVPKKISKARQTIQTKLDAWRDEARKPVTEWENQEKARVAAHTAAVGTIARRGNAEGQTAAQLRTTISELESMQFSAAQCEEFLEGYENARTRAVSTLRPMLALREQYERDQAELARLREAEEARKAAAARIAEAEKAKVEAAAKKEADLKAQIAALAAVAEDDDTEAVPPPSTAQKLMAEAVSSVTSPLKTFQRRRTPQEVEAAMVPRIAEALRPVLIAFEEQDVAIQAQNAALMERIARVVWREFRGVPA
jgi:hypothetical protein